MIILPDPLEFEWDKGNIDKNFKKHKVTNKEAEQIFINRPVFVLKDDKHSNSEKRHMIWGKTDNQRQLTVFFTIRKDRVRVISARSMNKKERREYEKKIEANTNI